MMVIRPGERIGSAKRDIRKEAAHLIEVSDREIPILEISVTKARNFER